MHLEGPFLSPRRLGTHVARRGAIPTSQLLDRLLDGGPVRLMTLAPGAPGAADVIERLLERGVAVSLGHSDATAEQANAAFDLGVRTVTHLFNAMRPFLHRDPGIVGAALARDDVIVQLILDGMHLAPETVRVVWRAAGGPARARDRRDHRGRRERGAYSFGSLDVAGARRHRARPRRRARGQRADDDRGRAEPARARRAARRRGRRRDGGAGARARAATELGRLAVGLPADVVVLDDRLEIVRVLVAGSVHVAV